MSTFDRDSFRVWSCSMKLVGATVVRFPAVAPFWQCAAGVPLRIHGQWYACWPRVQMRQDLYETVS